MIMSSEIEALQTQIAFQETAIQQMSDEIAQQQKQIIDLTNDVEQLRREIRAMTPASLVSPGDEPPPPHY